MRTSPFLRLLGVYSAREDESAKNVPILLLSDHSMLFFHYGKLQFWQT